MEPTEQDIEGIEALGFTTIQYFKQTKHGKIKLIQYSANAEVDLPIFHDTAISASLHSAYQIQES